MTIANKIATENHILVTKNGTDSPNRMSTIKLLGENNYTGETVTIFIFARLQRTISYNIRTLLDMLGSELRESLLNVPLHGWSSWVFHSTVGAQDDQVNKRGRSCY